MSQSTSTAIFPFCAECGAPECSLTRPLAACDRCCTVFYCSKECQENDWIYHRGSCNRIRAMTMEDDDIPYLSLDDTASNADTPPEISPRCSSPRDRVLSSQDTEDPAYSSLLDDYLAEPGTIDASQPSVKRNALLTPIRSVPMTPMSLCSTSSFGTESMVFSDSSKNSTAPSTPRTSLDAMFSTGHEQSDMTTPLLRDVPAVKDENSAEERRKAFLREILNEGFARAVDYIVDAIYEEPSGTSTPVY